MDRSSTDWCWTHSLGGVRAGDRGPYTIRRILFGMVQDHCRELGFVEGDTIRCRRRNPRELELQLASGSVRRLPVEYAWFIEVESAGRPLDQVRPA